MSEFVCPAAWAGGLDNSVRKWLHNPEKILKPYIKKGMTVLDFGCGPGYFTIEIAKLLEGSGKVIAADLQNEMLDIIRRKISGTDLGNMIVLHKCEKDRMGINERIDFILMFWMVHEVPNSIQLIENLFNLLNKDGMILIAEPKIHVTKTRFNKMLGKIKELKIKTEEGPKIFFSRTIILRK